MGRWAGAGKIHLLCDTAVHALEGAQPAVVVLGQQLGPDSRGPRCWKRSDLREADEAFRFVCGAAGIRHGAGRENTHETTDASWLAASAA